MIPNNTKSGIISIIRFSGEKKPLYFFSGLILCVLRVDAAGKTAIFGKNIAALTRRMHTGHIRCQRGKSN